MVLEGLTALSLGMSAFDSWRNNYNLRQSRNKKASYYDSKIKPLLEDINNVDRPDFNAIREAEMQNPINQFQNQMSSLSTNRDRIQSQSGFNESGFVNDVFMKEKNNATNTFQSQSFNINRGIQDMQTQFDDMLNQNRLKATELEYSYKYG
jgi:hypothetical protein